MNTIISSARPAPRTTPAPRTPVADRLLRAPAELLARERRLAIFGAVLLALVLPMALAWALDARELRGANVWIKPIKFALSIALLAFTTAWFVGHLPRALRTGRPVDRIVWTLMLAGGFELLYIGVQAAMGEASHFNDADALHAALYAAMGIGAIALTATQPMLAWQLIRHADTSRPSAYRLAVVLGLILCFVLGAGAGVPLSSLQPPDVGASVPVLGWSLHGADLRPAHFVGIHANQLIPMVGLAAAGLGERPGRRAVWAGAFAYTALFAALMAWGLAPIG